MTAIRSERLRESDLSRLGVFYTWEIDRHDIHSRTSVVRRLSDYCRRFGELGKQRSHAYNVALHQAFIDNLKMEQAELARLKAIGKREAINASS